jgi:type I restriction enzyme M protein
MAISQNLFCRLSYLTNEASVEKLFVDRLIDHLGYGDADLVVKTSIRELKIGAGSGSSLYKPDYIISANGFPAIVIDAKSPDEDLQRWVKQCRSYCLELNTMFEHNPVEFYLLSNGVETKLYKWDRAGALLEMSFDDFVVGNAKLVELKNLVSKSAIKTLSRQKHDELRESEFQLEPVNLDRISSIFLKLHDYMREKEKKTPPRSFYGIDENRIRQDQKGSGTEGENWSRHPQS